MNFISSLKSFLLSVPWWRHSALAAVLLTVTGAGTTVRGEPIAFFKLVFGPTAYVQGTSHGSFAPSPVHRHSPDPGGGIPGCQPPPPPFCPTFSPPYGFGGAPCAVWQTPFEIGEAEQRTVQLIGDSEHIVAPHAGESICGPVLHYAAAVSVPRGGGVRSVRYALEGGLHGGVDFDMLIVALAATSTAPEFGLETRGHIHGTMGIHVGNNKPRAATCHGGEEVPPNQTTSMGLMLLAVDPAQNTITLFAMVNDIPPQDITAALIHKGLPGENGPSIYDLASAGSWQPFGPQGSVIALHQTPFPAGFTPLLLSEQCYFNVATLQHPGGAIRGQIDDISRENTGAEPPGTDGTMHRSYSVPNPFVDRTSVQFALRQQSRVSLQIYDASGHLVRTLADGVTFAPGSRGIEWDGHANDGHRVARGIYVYKLQVGSSVESRRILFLR